MSAVGSPGPALKSLLLRSSTPASTEKVLLFLDGMEKDPPDPLVDDEASNDHSHRSGGTRGSARHFETPADGGVEYEGEDGEIRSDVQENNGSEMARTIPIHTTGIPEHEPGPNDPPGPHFESFGSSFGNFGPLPDGRPIWSQQPWQATPPKAAQVPLPETIPGSPTTISHPNPFQQFGMTPVGAAASAAGVPLPASVASGPSRTTQRSPPPQNGMNGVASPKSASRALSPTRTITPGGAGERPWSPRSGASAGPSNKSRVTQKTSRTQYPPLPESALEQLEAEDEVTPLRHHTTTPSIAPSESASQARSRRSARPTREAERQFEAERQAKSMRSATDANGNGHVNGGLEAGGSRYNGSQRDARSQGLMSPRSQGSQLRNGNMHAGPASPTPRQPPPIIHTQDADATPTPSRPASPIAELDADEMRMVNALLSRPPRSRTSYAPSAMAPSMLEPEIQNSHFHDMELCQLLHALDQPMGEPVKRAVRKAVRARVKKLGMKYDNESIRQYRKSYHDHDPGVHLNIPAVPTMPSSKRSTQIGTSQEPPDWARDLIDGMINMRERLDNLAPKIEKSLRSSRGGSYVTDSRYANGRGHQHGRYPTSEMDPNGGYGGSQMTQTVNIQTQPTGTMGDESGYQPETMPRESTHLHTLPGSMHHHDGSMHGAIREEDVYLDEEDMHGAPMATTVDGDTRGIGSSDYIGDRPDSPGQQYLEEELYKLRVKPTGSQSVATHKTWEVARDDGEDYEDDGDVQAAVTESGLPEIPDTYTGGQADMRGPSPPLPPLPQDDRGQMAMLPEGQVWHPTYEEMRGPPPWQRIHQRLLSWAIVWPMGELDSSLNSTTRGNQVDEIALSIWATQTYKRYVRAKMTDSPPGRVDRLFVPPNMADAISTAVYNGRHGDACGMLRDLWAPFGLEGMPRLLVVLAKHRSDENHWVVHRFSLPDGSLTTYDTYPERCLPDGRPLGWWFAIRIAWPDAIYPSPDHLMQKMVRLHRPMQLPIDNSVAAAGIWRNLLMGSRAERSLDLERLRDLINTEVKNLRQRKMMGKLSIGSPRPVWEDMP